MKLREIKKDAKAAMKNKYGYAILYTILFGLISVCSVFVGLIIGVIIVAGAITCSKVSFYMDIANRRETSFDSTFKGFKYFGKAFKASFYLGLIYLAILLFVAVVSVVLTIFVKATFVSYIIIAVSVLAAILLLIISVKSIFVFYVMVDMPELTASECIKKSWDISKFFKIIRFNLSYFGWTLLVILTFGILNLYVAPYYQTAKVNLYYSMKK